ncbi:MAG: Acetyl-coenzyme A synthetase [Hydrogenibacillus schlegelii]|uniref:Acetyl-coenzyme A synthetase n=1 Tax=Hydrogenibacillus schlegelii TaxID=1484 RepID=A0A2T5GBW6_HYDSH|nr:acetate--CoA ligase [Hydrogenibacillus schlegelii]PTQ53665.1 MAG: Acetyl-coenzyme A synthetase [Hydrogenibacillus schlegelii]
MTDREVKAAEGPLLESKLREERRFEPPADFRERAWVKDRTPWEEAERDFEGFWAKHAEAEVHWFKTWDRVLEWNPPWAKWFVGGETNASYNCVDRHALGPRRTKTAILWEGEPGDRRALTYEDLHREVQKFANVLKGLGVRKGDRVAIYMGMVPELVIAMLAAARIGATHTVVFGGFSSQALRDRIQDAQAKVLITQDGAWRRGQVVPLKQWADEALAEAPSVEKVVVLRRVGDAAGAAMVPGRDVWWHEAMAGAAADCPAEPLDSEHPLFILYTSGTTGKPKGVLHTTGGYLVGTTLTAKWVFDLKDDDVYFCAADIGWITGHSYIVYGPLSNGATVVIYEGAPDWPDKDRIWAIVEKYRATIFYTSPTFLRTAMRWGPEYPKRHDLSSLRLLGTVGEPINPEAWMWYHEHIGGGRCPIVDTWWQTETGMILIAPLPGVQTTKPGSATVPLPGIKADVVDEAGNPVPPNVGGYLVIERPWPAMFRTLWGDPDRYVKAYWSQYPGRYLTGDGARKDEDGYFWITGRVDDVVNVAGHRLSNIELESTLVAHPAVAEAAVIGRSDPIKGQALSAFVVLRAGVEPSDALKEELRQWVGEKIGPIAKPSDVFFAADLPKTRSAKIMRRLLRDIAEGRALGDTTTLTDPAVVEELRQRYIAEGKEQA